MAWWNPLTWFRKYRRSSKYDVFDKTVVVNRKNLHARYDPDKTITLPGNKTVKKDDGQEPTMPLKGSVRVKNVQWKPNKRKFKRDIVYHKAVLQTSLKLFRKHKTELGSGYKKLEDILATVDYCYEQNLDLQSVMDHNIYTVQVTAGLNQLRPINRELLKMAPIIRRLQLDSDTKKQFTILKNYVKDMIAYLEIISKTKEFKN